MIVNISIDIINILLYQKYIVSCFLHQHLKVLLPQTIFFPLLSIILFFLFLIYPAGLRSWTYRLDQAQMHTAYLTEDGSLENSNGHQENAADPSLPTHSPTTLIHKARSGCTFQLCEHVVSALSQNLFSARNSSQMYSVYPLLPSPFSLQSTEGQQATLFWRLIWFCENSTFSILQKQQQSYPDYP